MNKFLLASLIVLASVSTAQAHEEHGWGRGYPQREHYRGGCCGWVAPALIGGVIGAELARPYYYPPVVVEQVPAPVTVTPYQPQRIILGPNDVVINGVVYTKQLVVINGITQEVLVVKQ